MITVGSKIKEPLKQYTPTSTYTLVRYYTPYLLSSKLHRDEGRANIGAISSAAGRERERSIGSAGGDYGARGGPPANGVAARGEVIYIYRREGERAQLD